MTMQIFPAIDVKNGEVVRLTQGDYDRVEVYAKSPAEIAVKFRDKGAKNLHMVDLDGARDGVIVNYDAIKKAVGQSGLAVQIGGGIRDEERIKQYLEIGVKRVILGTIAVEDFAFVERMTAKYGSSIAVGVDARDGKVAVKGWRELTDVDSVSFCKKLERAGVKTIIYTDISKDGMGTGTNLDIYRRLAGETRCDIIASGGISYLDELKTLTEIGTYGAIVGKAIYTGALKLEEVLTLC
jgi:phosphoribosylformimino-5-aminoimidazole carboxamide ribotide isomerase